jgi:hypothetical protein
MKIVFLCQIINREGVEVCRVKATVLKIIRVALVSEYTFVVERRKPIVELGNL